MEEKEQVEGSKRRRLADLDRGDEKDGGEGDPGKDPPNCKESTGLETEEELPHSQGEGGGDVAKSKMLCHPGEE